MALEDEDAGTGVDEGAQKGAEEGAQAGAEGTAEGSAASNENRLAESLAAELGWSPKEKWRGPETDWKPARDFLKTTVEVNKARGREIKQLNERVERIARTSATMAEQAAEQARTKVLAEHAAAVEAGDADGALKASQKLNQIGTQPAPDSAAIEFKERNSTWLEIDPIATAVAYNVCEVWARKGADASKQLEEAEKTVRKRFPELFEDAPAPARTTKQPGAEVPGSRSAETPRRGPKGFNDLPAEAKAAALDFEKRGRASKEDYAKVYWQENA